MFLVIIKLYLRKTFSLQIVVQFFDTLKSLNTNLQTNKIDKAKTKVAHNQQKRK